MRNIAFLCIPVLLFSLRGFSQPYGLSLNTLDNRVVNLSGLTGKKVLVVTVPLSGQDTSVTPADLLGLESAHAGDLVVIGVPAIEAGYGPAVQGQVAALYGGQPSSFILSAGMYVGKAAGASQAPLFQWLTHWKANGHFDQDVAATGYKFFLDERGNLYAVLGPGIRLSNAVIGKILSKPAPGTNGTGVKH
jgi:glutathione peroxidase